MKKLITVLSVAFILLSMSACSVETSSTSTSTFTTTTTDAEGNTTETTTTTTTENGVTTSNTLTTSADDPTGLRSKWREYFILSKFYPDGSKRCSIEVSKSGLFGLLRECDKIFSGKT